MRHLSGPDPRPRASHSLLPNCASRVHARGANPIRDCTPCNPLCPTTAAYTGNAGHRFHAYFKCPAQHTTTLTASIRFAPSLCVQPFWDPGSGRRQALACSITRPRRSPENSLSPGVANLRAQPDRRISNIPRQRADSKSRPINIANPRIASTQR